MLLQKYRLKKMKDFEILFEKGYFVRGNLVNAKVLKIDLEKYAKRGYSKDDLRIGVIVSIKVEKSAVKRNRIKRKMREVVRLLIKEKKVLSGYHVALIATQKIVGEDYEAIEKDILQVLKKAKILK